jgi:translocator protein
MKIKNIFQLIGSIMLCLIAGGIGSIFTAPQITGWYMTLNKPFLNPPNWIFAPVWTTLYILMGISLFLVWRKNEKTSKPAIAVFLIQLLINVLWSVIFFNMHLILAAYVWIIIMWVAILVTMLMFYKFSKTATWLLLPYILWVSFASYLNLGVYLANR